MYLVLHCKIWWCDQIRQLKGNWGNIYCPVSAGSILISEWLSQWPFIFGEFKTLKKFIFKKKVHTLRCLPIKSFWSILLVCHIVSPTLQIHFGGVAGERPLLSSGQLVPGFSYSSSVLDWYVMQIGLFHVWNSVFCIIHDGRLHAFGASVGYKYVQFYFVCKFANFL